MMARMSGSTLLPLQETDTSTTAGSGSSPTGGTTRKEAVSGIQGYDAQTAALSVQGASSVAADSVLESLAPTTDAPAEAPAPAGPRAAYLAYRSWIEARILELELLTGQGKLDRARGLLWQMEDVALKMKTEVVDINALSKTPTAGAAANAGGVPPEWIKPARTIIGILENPIAGVEASLTGRVEGSKYADEDWNSRLGVPQYRTQSDNLTSPEATCNGTSAAMVFERVGVGRADVVKACETAMGLTAESTAEVKTAKWIEKVEAYLTNQNAKGSNYQKPRGQSQSATTRTTMSGDFKANAQMEDMVLFLAWLKGIGHTSITSSSANLGTLLTAMDGTDGTKIATVEKLESMGTWKDFSKKISDTLNGGGAVVYSFYHKGTKAGESGKTHIITVQRMLDDGFIVDDPYGQIRSDYSHKTYGDAYANAGSMTRVTKNQVHRTGDDWKVDQAQNAEADETRGDSVKVNKKTIEDSFYYVQLLKRTPPHQEEATADTTDSTSTVKPSGPQ